VVGGDVLNDAFETLNVLNAPFRTSQQPDTSALPLNKFARKRIGWLLVTEVIKIVRRSGAE